VASIRAVSLLAEITVRFYDVPLEFAQPPAAIVSKEMESVSQIQ
jgi:hypothetical protein